MRRTMRVLPFLAVLAAALPAWAQHDRAALEAEFARKMSGVRMVGTYTDDARPAGSAPEEDGYVIEKVTKLEDGRWRFDAKISFRTVEMTIPFTLDVEWAGDTPVICVTDMGVPGLGTYTARILIYGDEYAGTWRGKRHGGHMFGRIVRDEQTAGAGVNWPSFRGPQASGIAEGHPTVTEWDLESGENVRWKQPIAGLSHAAPVIWGERIYLVTSVGEKQAPLEVGLYGSVKPVEDEGAQKFQVLCLDKQSGETLWTRTAFEGVPRFKRHPKGSFAASTPATDGSHVVAQFGTEGLFCYDADGKQLWKKDLGELDARWYVMPDTDWGFASSPVLHGKSVIVQCDVMGDSFLAALDVDTGEEIWRTARDELPGWGTPTVDVRASRAQVIVNGYKHIGGYDLETGDELWKLVGGGDIPVPDAGGGPRPRVHHQRPRQDGTDLRRPDRRHRRSLPGRGTGLGHREARQLHADPAGGRRLAVHVPRHRAPCAATPPGPARSNTPSAWGTARPASPPRAWPPTASSTSPAKRAASTWSRPARPSSCWRSTTWARSAWRPRRSPRASCTGARADTWSRSGTDSHAQRSATH